MPRVSDMIESKFLRKEDFDEEGAYATIKGVSLESMQSSGDTKWCLYFSEHAKGMVLNNTTIRVLESAYGDDSDGWIGKKVRLYVDPNVMFGKQVVGGLRISPVRAQQQQAKTTTKLAPPPQEFDDDIPI